MDPLTIELEGLKTRVGALERGIAALLRDGAPGSGARLLPDGTLTRREVARYLGLKPQTLARYASEKIGPPFKLFRGKAFYRLETVDEWARQFLREGARREAGEAPLPLLAGLAEDPIH